MATPTSIISNLQVNTGAAATGGQSDPRIIGLANGNILVAWTEDAAGAAAGGFGIDIVGKVYSSNYAVVRDSFRLNESRVVDNEMDFDIAPTNDGGFVIVYVDNDISTPNNSDLLWERYSATFERPATARLAFEAASADRIYDPSITVNQLDNSSLVTWTFSDGGNDNVHGIVVSSTGTAGPEFAAGQNSPDDDRNSDAAILSDGNYVSLYEEFDANEPSVDYGLYIPTSVPTGVATTSSSFSSGINTDPRVASLADGGFVAVWHAADTENGNIEFELVKDNGRDRSGVIQVATGADIQDEPDVVALPDGDFVIVWDNDTTNAMQAARFNPDGTPDGSTFTVWAGSIGAPSISVTADGRILFAWIQGEVFLSIWDPRGDTINLTDLNRNLPNFMNTSTYRLGQGAYTINGTPGDDIIRGGTAGFTLDRLNGAGGNDTLIGGPGADQLDGGAGDGDTADYSDADEGISIGFFVAGSRGMSEGDTLVSIERIVGSEYDDSLFGGGTGFTLEGGDGDDQIFDSTGASFLFGGGGDWDTIFGSAGADSIDGGAGAFDTVRYASSPGGVTVNLATGTGARADAAGDTYAGIEVVFGSSHADTLIGDANANTLDGFGGADRLDGGGGDDVLIGGLDADSLTGGSGHDTVRYDLSNDFVNVGLFRVGTGGHSTGDTMTGIEHIIGSGFSDTLVGANTQSATLEGGAGNDVIFDLDQGSLLIGGEQFDILVGNGGDDTLFGGTGFDTMLPGPGADDVLDSGEDLNDTVSYLGTAGAVTMSLATNTGTQGDAAGDTYSGIENLIGGDGDDSLTGDGGFNQLFGSAGEDTIDGLGGDDYLYGGRIAAGQFDGVRDTFVFSQTNWGRDLILDWEDGIDKLSFSRIGLTFDDFTVVDTPQGVRLDWFNADFGQTMAVHLFGVGLSTASIDASDFV